MWRGYLTHKAPFHAPGPEADAEFDYMQRAEATRMDEAAALSCMEKLLADFEPSVFLPLLLRSASDPSNATIQVCRKSTSLLYNVQRWSPDPVLRNMSFLTNALWITSIGYI